MVDFGEELVIFDSYRVPWLIWIQMLVFFLLLILLYALDIFSLDLSDNSTSSSSSSAAGASTSGAFFPPGDPAPANSGSKFFANSSVVQSNQSIKGEITPSATRRVIRGENVAEGEGCSTEKETTRKLHHPCSLFQIAGSAFLKCLGIDRTKTSDDDDD